MGNYRLQIRKYSSNIIEKKIISDGGKETWIPYIAPLVNKKLGDIEAKRLLHFLNY